MILKKERKDIKNNKLKPLEKALLHDGYKKADLRKANLISKADYESNVRELNFDDKKYKNSDDLFKQYCYWYSMYYYKNILANNLKHELKNILNLRIKKSKTMKELGLWSEDRTRFLHEDRLHDVDIVSLFESSLSRTIGINTGELSRDLVILQIYYFDIFKDLVFNGMFFGTDRYGRMIRYKYFTSSAGQIRTKKAVFIKEDVWNQHQRTLMCGLTVEKINLKGGNNANKHLAYMALTNSATDQWSQFDIDKTIVVDDFESNVPGEFDLIDDVSYEIKRVHSEALIPHLDGVGMARPDVLEANSMFRAPWIKGLLAVFAYDSLVKEKGWSSKITDIYGKEYDIFEDDIQIIFTKSQFKMYKYYNSWDEYKELFKKHHCTAGLCNMEEERIKNATINYQMLQTLTDVSNDEIETIASASVKKITTLCDSVENMKRAIGVTPYNKNLSPFQKAVKIYPNLLHDTYAKDIIRDIKNSLLKKYRGGKLEVYGKYTFILPDLYAACEYYFGKIENPVGLLANKEVYCSLFKNSEKLDCLRSPHLYKEHAVRHNVAHKKYSDRNQEIERWFTTKALYTSTHDLISRVLQFDVDGDKALVVADKYFVDIAERNMRNIVPLYYNMKTAEPNELNTENIYKSLVAAFKESNIGLYSNNITKIFNSGIFTNGTAEEKSIALNVVKWLCMENNFVIDYAKTLYKPKRPENVDSIITKHTKGLLPSFFQYAKDKQEGQCRKRNDSFVNQLFDIIPNPRIDTRKLKVKKINHALMMSDANIKPDEEIVKLYDELNRKYRYKINMKDKYIDNLTYVADDIRSQFMATGYTETEVSDMLVSYLYNGNKRYKQLLWFVFGYTIVENLKNNVKQKLTKYIQCIDCGEWFEVASTNTTRLRCDDCRSAYRKKYQKELMQQRRKKC